MNFCLPKNLVDDFLKRMKSGEIDPQKLSEMTSAERHSYFSSFLGDNNALKVNALFESKLLLKNQQQGIINWAKQVSGIKPEVKRDILSRVERMDKVLNPKDLDSFLSDLAEQRLGFGVTLEEAGKISELAKNVSEKKYAIPQDSLDRSQERIDYGLALVEFKDYTGKLKAEAKDVSYKESLQKIGGAVKAKSIFDITTGISGLTGKLIKDLGGITKSILASLDDSFFGRQGLVTLLRRPDMWMKNLMLSFGDIKKELKGIDAMTPIKADVWSRRNAINGNYQAMGVDIGITSEEALPSQLPEKIPLFGRLYKASESAYNGAAMRCRADLADVFIKEAEAQGVNVKDPETDLGQLINSMTGRGKVSLTPSQSEFVNVTIFSIRYLKSNIDLLTDWANPKISKFSRRIAAENISRLIIFMGGILATAKFFDRESVELDPRSNKFGKVMVGKNHEIPVNISLGIGSLLTLASRITPTRHNGVWGFWSKNNKGFYVRLDSGKFGVGDPFDRITDFMKGKSAPIARLLLTMWEGRTFKGEKPSFQNQAIESITPIPLSNMFELAKTSAGADPLLYSILTSLDLLGVNVSVSLYQDEYKKASRLIEGGMKPIDALKTLRKNVYGDEPIDSRMANQLLSGLTKAIIREKADNPFVDDLIYASSSDEKKEILFRMKKNTPLPEFKKLLTLMYQARVVNNKTMKKQEWEQLLK